MKHKIILSQCHALQVQQGSCVGAVRAEARFIFYSSPVQLLAASLNAASSRRISKPTVCLLQRSWGQKVFLGERLRQFDSISRFSLILGAVSATMEISISEIPLCIKLRHFIRLLELSTHRSLVEIILCSLRSPFKLSPFDSSPSSVVIPHLFNN